MTARRVNRGWLCRVGAVGLIVVGCALASCGLPQDDVPQTVAADGLPRSLRDANPSSSTTLLRTERTQKRTIYLVQTTDNAESLYPVSVDVQLPADLAVEPRVITEKLVNSPPVAENSAFTTAIPPGTRVLGATRDGDVLNIDLSNLGTVEGSRQRLAFAQIVYTVTAAGNAEGPPITGVRFSIDHEPTPVPLDDRTADPGTVIRRDDFSKLRPSASTTTIPGPEPAPVPPDVTTVP